MLVYEEYFNPDLSIYVSHVTIFTFATFTFLFAFSSPNNSDHCKGTNSYFSYLESEYSRGSTFDKTRIDKVSPIYFGKNLVNVAKIW